MLRTVSRLSRRRIRSRLGTLRVKYSGLSGSYAISVGAGLIDSIGERLRSILSARTRRVALISNRKVYGLFGAQLESGLKHSGWEVPTWLLGDGERHKSLASFERALRFFSEHGLERTDCVVSLGGGVVGDLAGFAAATYLRGVAFVQVPTTLLSQIDSSIGGKVGVNSEFGKNLIGAFHHPRAVFIDTDTLLTLPRRELVAGWCEAIKQGAIGSRPLFKRTVKYLETFGLLNSCGASAELEQLIAAQCAFKSGIVARDEREDPNRVDAKSRRILNFGHTVGHALETATDYRRFRHGEAVGIGMLVAGEIGKRLGITPQAELKSLHAAVKLLGRLPRTDDVEPAHVMSLLQRDKKSVDGSINWILLDRLGLANIVDGKDIPPGIVKGSIRSVLASC
jgi:3-dehydroquinate synthase